MTNYDFTSSLSPIDFELFSKDLLEAEFDIRLENFREGKDKGIDLRFAPQSGQNVIVQCKRYGTYAALKSVMKREELPKIQALKPSRYILTTSVALSPQEADELKTILSPLVLSTGDIFGRDRLNSILDRHPEIERRHIKLWIGSSGVLDSIVNAGTHVVSQEEIERTIAAAKIYVRNPSFDEALSILREHRVCIISGLPGIGKTTLARMLLLYFYNRKYDIVKIESDISEARKVGYHDSPRFYYYDDFLGQTAQADKLNKNEDQKILDFMRTVHDSKNSLFVLTTREYILNQAKLHYEKFDREKFDHRTCVIDLSKYSRRIRAQILYNHLCFSDLPPDHVECLIRDRGYVQIVDHKNYNPRLIEYLTSAEWVGSTPSEEYLFLFLSSLDNPVTIWRHAFRNQLSHRARHLIFVLTTLPTEVFVEDLEVAFGIFHESLCSKFGISRTPKDFQDSLKELDGTFISIRKQSEDLMIGFQNPSIRDFMQNVILEGELVIELLENSVFFEQTQWFSSILVERKSPSSSSSSSPNVSNYIGLAIDRMQQLVEASSCSLQIYNEHGTADKKVLGRVPANQASRVAIIATELSRRNEAESAGLVDLHLKRLSELIQSGTLSTEACINPTRSLKREGCLLTEAGGEFLQILKSEAMSRLDTDPYINDFETVAELISEFPVIFDDEDSTYLNGTYSNYIKEYAADLSGKAWFYPELSPENRRYEADRVKRIGDIFGTETGVAQQSIREYADEMERGAEKEWEPDFNLEDREGHSESFRDVEMEGMFNTLKE